MFCGHCGQHNPDASRVCASCGQEIRLSLSLTPAPAPASAPALAPLPQQPPALSNLESHSEPKGVGGWLLFFCVLITIISPILLLGAAALYRSEGSIVLFNLTLAVLSLWTGI